jgi:hypothetical protein
MTRHLRSVPNDDSDADPVVPDVQMPPRAIAPKDVVEAFRYLGLDPDSVTAINVTTHGLIAHSRTRLPGAIHLAERALPDGSTIHTNRFPWTQEAHP